VRGTQTAQTTRTFPPQNPPPAQRKKKRKKTRVKSASGKLTARAHSSTLQGKETIAGVSDKLKEESMAIEVLCLRQGSISGICTTIPPAGGTRGFENFLQGTGGSYSKGLTNRICEECRKVGSKPGGTEGEESLPR